MDQGNVTPEPQKSGNGQKNTIIALIIIALLALGWYLAKNKNTSNTEVKSQTESSTTMNHESDSSQMSLKELMTLNKTQKCDVSFANETAENKGTVYFGDGKMRGDFTSTTEGKTSASHMINDGENMYMWMDGQNTAVKMSASAIMDKKPDSVQQPAVSLDDSAKHDYKCGGWNVDSALLTPPAEIHFTDMSSMMQNMPTSGTNATTSASVKAQQCAACENAGAGKVQCLAALSCN